MGIPVWKPKKQQQQQEQENALHSTFQNEHSITHHHGSQYRLHRRRRRLPTLLAEPYYLAADGYTTSTTHTSISSQQSDDELYPRSQLVSPSRTRIQNTMTTRQQQHRLEIETQIQQRFNEKQELLDQLKITISLLDQFLSIRELSGQQYLALPPFITDDLLAILTATSTTLTTSTNIIDSNLPVTNDTNLPPTTTTLPLRSYGRPYNDTSLTQLVDRMIESPPHASRWAELESDIASTHRRVCEQLDRLGTTSLPSPSQLTTHSMQSS